MGLIGCNSVTVHDARISVHAGFRDRELSAIVRAGCFASEQEARHEAVRTLFAVKPQLRMEAAIRRPFDRMD